MTINQINNPVNLNTMKTLTLFFAIFFSYLFTNGQNPTWEWAASGGGGKWAYGCGVAIKGSDLYLGGRYGGSCAFGIHSVTGTAQNNEFHGKFDTSGLANCTWLKADNFSTTTGDEDYADDLAIDRHENNYIVGVVNGNVNSSNGWFVDKYNSAGVLRWSRNPANVAGVTQSTQMPTAYGVCADYSSDSDNIYIVGQFTKQVVIPGESGNITLTAVSASDDIFLAKLDSNGKAIWAVSAGGSNYDGGRSVTVDREGNPYICGSYNGTATFGTGAGAITTPASSGSGFGSFFVAKYDKSGNPIWVQTSTNTGFSGSGTNRFWQGQNMTVDSCGNSYVTGTFYITAQFGSFTLNDLSGGGGSVFVAKLNVNGTWEWAKSAGGSGGDGGATVRLDKYSDVYVCGTIGSTNAFFDTIPAPRYGSSSMFVAKFANGNGACQWVKTQDAGSTGSSSAQGLAIDQATGYVYVSGSVNGNSKFGISNITSAAAGNILLVKLDTIARRAILPVVSATYCPGETVKLPYTIMGTFNSTNSFTAQLSDANGSFANPVQIGDTALKTSGFITITIPAGTAPGSNYLIRVVSSSPSTSSYASGCGFPGAYTNNFYVTISNNVVNLAVTPANPSVCPGSSVTLKATGGTTYGWTGTADVTDSLVVSPTSNTTYTLTGSNGLCSGMVTTTVIVNQTPTVNVSTAQNICIGSSTPLTASGGTTYTWTPNTFISSNTVASPVVNPPATTVYTVTASNGNCSASNNVLVTVNPLPTGNAIGTATVLIGESTALGVTNTNATGGITYSWTPTTSLSCTTCANPIATPTITTNYTLAISDNSGCSDSSTVLVTVKELCGPVYVPTAFSPNGDGTNDLFKVMGNCIKGMTLAIYDRWGNAVYESTDPNGVWNGTWKGQNLNTGTYVYSLVVTDADNNTVNKKGNVTLVR